MNKNNFINNQILLSFIDSRISSYNFPLNKFEFAAQFAKKIIILLILLFFYKTISLL